MVTREEIAAPIRIQRRRTKGFSLQAQSPDGRPVVSVCRPGKWGNPFIVGEQLVNVGMVVLNHADLTREEAEHGVITPAVAVKLFRAWLVRAYSAETMRLSLYQLQGLHLACWCKPGAPCHADVLLELANAPAPPALSGNNPKS